jgi:hypothetical protein
MMPLASEAMSEICTSLLLVKVGNTGSRMGGGMAFENRREAIAFPRKVRML